MLVLKCIFIFLFFISIIKITTSMCHYDLPDYLTRCNLSSPTYNDCFLKACNDGLKKVCRGDRKFHVPCMQPSFIWQNGCVLHNSTDLYFALLPGIEIFNMCGYEVIGAQKGSEPYSGTGIMINPHIEMKANYVLQGRILNNYFSGSSKGSLYFGDVLTTWYTHKYLTEEPESHIQYLYTTKIDMTFDANYTLFSLNNLKKPGNSFLNQHQLEVFQLIKLGLEECIGELFLQFVGRYLAMLKFETVYDH